MLPCIKCLYLFFPSQSTQLRTELRQPTYATIKPDGYKNVNSSSLRIY